MGRTKLLRVLCVLTALFGVPMMLVGERGLAFWPLILGWAFYFMLVQRARAAAARLAAGKRTLD